jgi:tRNA(adenine34) deaminase
MMFLFAHIINSMKQINVSIHETFVRRCLELARIALYGGDAPVGSLVVRHGQIIAEGIEGVKAQQDVTWHAELDAVRNVEPCVMCSYAIRQTGISEVVIGMETASLGGISSACAILCDPAIPGWGPPPAIVIDILREECLQLHSSYSQK